MKLSDLIAPVSAKINIIQDVYVTDLSLDSRLVKPGDLFFACLGTKADGRLYIDDAISNGAVAVLIEGDEIKLEHYRHVPIISIPQLKNKIGEIAACFLWIPHVKCV